MENRDILSILSDYVNGRETSSFQWGNNDEELVRISRRHNLGGIIYKQTGIISLQQDYYACAYRYCKRNELLKEIQNLFSHNCIEFFFVKGPIIAEAYPDSFLRTMGDVDITIHQEDLIKAKNILIENGYCFNESELQREYEWHFSKNECSIELHHALLYKERVNDERYVQYFNKCWEHVLNNTLDASFHFLYVMFHMRKHFLNGGIGIRFFLDLAMLSRNRDIDWNYVSKELTNLHLIDFTCICNALCEKWFGVRTYFSIHDLPDAFVEKATKSILDGSVFGKENTTNDYVKTTNLIRKYNMDIKGMPYCIRSVVYMLRTVFPSYTEISKTYTFIKGKPFLLPFAWIYRIVDVAIHKPKDALMEIKNPYIYYKDIRDREKLYKEWKV